MISNQEVTGTLPDAVGRYAATTPHAVAVSAGDGTLTYAELDHASDQWAALLRSDGAKPHDVIGICIARSTATIAAMLGVMKARGVFLMLDPEHPHERRRQLVTNARCSLIVDEHALSNLSDAGPAPDDPGQAGDAAYVVFTSGSTGTPKGVLCGHDSLRNVVTSQRSLLDVTPADRVAAVAPLTVDAFIAEVALALGSGAALHLADERERHPGLLIERFLRTREITVLLATPTTLRTLDPDQHPNLRLVISAGEALDVDLARQWKPGRRLVNHYGPTEATIWTTQAEVSGDELEIPLGDPIPGARIDVLRPSLEPTEDGEIGEIYISGAGLSRGYLNVESDDAFVERPWGRAYRTGDRAVRREDGTIVFVGRQDEQIKLGGLRVELGEVRHHVLQHPMVANAAVRLDSGRLVAYMTRVGTDEATPDELMLFLEERLPFQLVPTTYVYLDALPTTDWGKLDVGALRTVPMREPTSPIEEYLTKLTRELLELDQVSVADDLFMLGMNSILIATFSTRIARDHSIELEPIDFFEHPTVIGLAQTISQRQTQ